MAPLKHYILVPVVILTFLTWRASCQPFYQIPGMPRPMQHQMQPQQQVQQQQQVANQNMYIPRFPVASIALSVGHLKAFFTLGSDTSDLTAVKDLKQFNSITNLAPEAKKELQLITKNLLETFGLYEPFKKTTKSMIVNNPVYHGHQSGMVNYIKKGSAAAEEVSTSELKAELAKGLSSDARHETSRNNGKTQ